MTSIDVSPTRLSVTLVRLLWLSTLVLVLISVAIVTRRALTLFGLVSASRARSEAPPLDDAFARYAPLTMIHIVPGLIFVVLGPFQFVRTLRRRRPPSWRGDLRLFVLTLAKVMLANLSARINEVKEGRMGFIRSAVQY